MKQFPVIAGRGILGGTGWFYGGHGLAAGERHLRLGTTVLLYSVNEMKPNLILPIMWLVLAATALVAGDEIGMDLPTALSSVRTNGMVGLREGYRGKLDTVYSWGDIRPFSETNYVSQTPIEFTNLRFDKKDFRGWPERTSICSLRFDPRNSINACYNNFVFRPDLPQVEAIKSYTTTAQFIDAFDGCNQPLFTGWVGTTTVTRCWKSWYCFTLAPSNAIRVMSVRLLVIGRKQKEADPAVAYQWTLAGGFIRQGIFLSTGEKPRLEHKR